jgi:uncharacterized surface protein with fasciclin (FAS1) repeats
MGNFPVAEHAGTAIDDFRGNMVTVSLVGEFNTAGVVEFDIIARNGVLHKIDEYWAPPR